MKTTNARTQVAALAVSASLLANMTAAAAPLCIDAVNPQYFYYNGKTTALVGYSPEYICHLEQRSGTAQATELCNYGNYPQVINELAMRHLNVLRIWVGLGHSPGGAAGPLPNEQPFAYDQATGKWDLYAWNQTFFERLEEVVDYAEGKNVIVELTLFDAFSGDFRTSPWYLGKNSNGYIGLADEWTLAAAPGTTCKPFTDPANIYSRQKALIEKTVTELNHHDNIYWELANEPELSQIHSGYNSSGPLVDDTVSVPRIVKWHECVTDIVRTTEGTMLAPKRHLIAANYHTQTALSPFRVALGAYAPDVRILTGHYIQVRDSGRLSATEKQRTYLTGGLQGIDRVYGFNEGRPTPSYGSTANFRYILPEEARAEAWEFMLGEGGIYNHYTTDWSTPATGANQPQQIRIQLGRLADFLAGLNLRGLRRSFNNPPAWAPNLPLFGTSRPNGSVQSNVYWSAMHQNGSAYVLYLHHSALPGAGEGFKAYVKPASILPLGSIDLQPAAAASNYTATWINPATGGVIGTFTIVADGVRRSYTIPPYSYDIALKINNGSSVPGTQTCAP